jgi:hypothetical protein
MIFCLVGCRALFNLPQDGGTPFNGPITFHELALTIPKNFIRDSTQSTQDAWLFEKGFYSRMIILTRNDQSGDVEAGLNSYRERMKEIGAASERTTFLELPAVHSTYTKDGTYCQEILFVYHGSYYAIALRGGDEEEFRDLLATVSIVTPVESDTVTVP